MQTQTLAHEDVASAFDDAAERYDVMVALNPGYHRHLRAATDALVERLPHSRRPLIADLGCGSGASTRALVRSLEHADHPIDVVGVDASKGMLEQARRKVWPDGVDFVHGRAEELSFSRVDWRLSRSADAVFAAYLFRNLTERDDVLDQVHEVLAPGGVLVTQEYSVAHAPHAAIIWSLVCWLLVIPLSWLTSRETRLYRYLWRSVREFDSVDRFIERLHRAGFVDVEVRTVPGWQRGILHTFRARKADEC